MIDLHPESESIRSWLAGRDDGVLFSAADSQRRAVFGDKVFVRGIVEFSNYCRQDCHYCGLRRSNRAIRRYRLSKEEILTSVAEAVRCGVQTIVLQAGEDGYYSDQWIADLIRTIKSRYAVAITLSLGEHPAAILQSWRAAGADRYLLRIETFNRQLYAQARPGKNWEQRFACLANIRAAGYETGSGIMIGLPGESISDLAQAVLELTVMKPDMIGLGPFVSHSQTPWKAYPNGSIDLVLRTIALIRLLNPYANIPATSALNSAQPGARVRGLQVGANVIMPSFTPRRVREWYTIYPGKNISPDASEDTFEQACSIIAAAGYTPDLSRGDSPHYLQRTTAVLTTERIPCLE